MALPATDDFNRADTTTDIGANWTFINGTIAFIISSNAARAFDAASISIASWNADAFPDDQYAVVTSVQSAVFIGAGVRLASGADGYGSRGDGYLTRYDDAAGFGGETVLSNHGVTASAGQSVRAEAEGTTIRAFTNGIERASVTDATYASGSAGLVGYSGAGNSGDDWEGGSLGAAPSGHPTMRRFGRTPFGLSGVRIY
jgi:hypothetical protein